MKRHIFPLLLLAAVLALGVIGRQEAPEEPFRSGNGRPPPIYPGAAWATSEPASIGMDPAKVRDFVRSVGPGSFGCLVRDGYVVSTWGWEWMSSLWPARRRGWASATKPYIAILLPFAVHEGRIHSLDALVRDFGWDLRNKDRTMTLRHLVNMTSGYGLPEPPGQGYAYNDYGVKLLFLTLLERIFSVDSEDVDAVEALFDHPDRLGALKFEEKDSFRQRNDLPRLDKSTCDFARFGLLLMRGGRWRGRQLLPEALVREYLRPGVPGSLPRTAGGEVDDYLGIGTAGGGHDATALGPGVYGFHWWFNVEGRLWPDVPHDAFQANGHWNRHALTIIPSLGLVVAWRESSALTAHPDSFHIPMNEALKILVDSIGRAGATTERNHASVELDAADVHPV